MLIFTFFNIALLCYAMSRLLHTLEAFVVKDSKSL